MNPYARHHLPTYVVVGGTMTATVLLCGLAGYLVACKLMDHFLGIGR